MHLDVHTDDLAAEVLQLQNLGAEVVKQVHSWQVMRDPGRTAVLRDPRTTRNAQRLQRTTLTDPVRQLGTSAWAEATRPDSDGCQRATVGSRGLYK
jgi:hypothetical protein